MNARDFLPPAIEFEEHSDPHIQAVAEFEEISQRLDLEEWVVNRLRHTEREVAVNLPLMRDDGRADSFSAHRIQHFSSGGPTLGAVAISPTALVSQLRADAMQATWQAELLNLPFGGAAGAIICNPDDLSERELRSLSKDYIHALRGIAGRDMDVVMPGAHCNEQTMAWMLDSHAQTKGHLEPGGITGKPASMWGIAARGEMIRTSAVIVLRNACARTNRALAGQRISIQGFGEPGAYIARALFEAGACVIAVADISGGIRNEHGIDIAALTKHADEQGVIFGFPDASPACNADIVEADCDILVLAATERQITTANAQRVKARMVMEAVQRAVTPAAEAALAETGRVVIPAILATSGEMVLAFVEWNQSANFSSLSTAEILGELETRIGHACDSAFAMAEQGLTTLRRAATSMAVDRIARELRLRR